MCLICEARKPWIKEPAYKGWDELDVSQCKKIETIPNIETLEELNCWGCPKLTFIANIKNLITLRCNHCPLLKKIPDIQGLDEVVAEHCYSLEEIPLIQELFDLNINLLLQTRLLVQLHNIQQILPLQVLIFYFFLKI